MDIDAIAEAAILLSKKGYNQRKIIDILNDEGVPLSIAFAVVKKIYEMKAKAYRDSAKQALISGTLLLLLGALITLATFALGIGFVIITKGLIFVGILNICRGVWYILKSYFL